MDREFKRKPPSPREGGDTRGDVRSNRRQDSVPSQATRGRQLAPRTLHSVQNQPAASSSIKQAEAPTTRTRSAWSWTTDPWMDAAHRGTSPPNPAPTSVRAVQRSDANAPQAGAAAAGSASAQPIAIDPPQAAINKPGFIDHKDGSNIRTGPAESAGVCVTAQPLPPATRVFVSGRHPHTPEWLYVCAFLPNVMVRGYVQHFRVTTDLPEPSAKLYEIQSGDTVESLAAREFSAAVQDGHDLRYYENVLLAVNRDHNRAGIKGDFQRPNVLGGGADNIQLEAGRRIWLLSPAYAQALAGTVPDGSLTGGSYAQARRAVGHIDDLLRSVTDSPQHFGAVAGEYADVIKDHLPEIIAITAGFIAAEALSAFLAATPTGVGQIAAVIIQLGLAAFGAAFAVEAGVQALEHAKVWLTLAWTAHGDPVQLAAASREFLKMLVNIAMAALAIMGARGNASKGLNVADAIAIQPPKIGMSPAMVTPEGAMVPGAPMFSPGSIATTGPVDIGISAMSAAGAGGTRATGRATAGQASGSRAPNASQWHPPASATKKLPSEWGGGKANKKGAGMRWQDPNNPGNGVRIDRGNPSNSQPTQRVDHVVVRREGKVIGRDGKPIAGSIKDDPVAAHIPLSEWLRWSTWFSP